MKKSNGELGKTIRREDKQKNMKKEEIGNSTDFLK